MRNSDSTPSTVEMAIELGLSREEYAYICRKLERKPNFAELGIFSAMYSEHCSYKSSKRYFKRFPTTGKRVLQGPGENAGILDLGDGWAVAFKMESHNHPSYIEPYQGAATGVGGILRDIFTMGARPIANMDALFFGSPEDAKTHSLVRGVVKGIGDYGNCVGVPTVAGQTLFHPCYTANPLVNAFTLGIVKTEQILKGIAKGKDNIVMYVGSKTGRDGVHGATMASKEFSSEGELERPAVQVGDPFTEKLLLEATLEVAEQNLVVGIQDMGAAGLTSSSFEMAHRGASGLELNLDAIPQRETAMSAYELLLSESQERMLLVAEPKNLEKLKAIYDKWDLHAEVIGKVTEGSRVKMFSKGELVVDLPIELVVEPPMPERPQAAPSDLKQRWFLERNRMLATPLETKVLSLLKSLNFADVSPIIHQYDSMVGNRTLATVLDDASVLRLREIKSKNIRLALATDCNPRVCWLWPQEGGRRAVAEAALNVALRGAEPIGITDCLNFGSPENTEVMWQFAECVEGISQTCDFLKVPVISGNVSFYNETDGKPIYPTPMIGMVGVIEDNLPLPLSYCFSTELELGLIGPLVGGLGGSLFASEFFGRDCGQPEETDLTIVDRMIKWCQVIRRKKMTLALHDAADGGLLAACLEMAFRSPHECTGISLEIPHEADVDSFLFGETIPRVIAAYEPVERVDLEATSSRGGLKFHPIGSVNDSGRLKIFQGSAVVLDLAMKDIRSRWEQKYKVFF